METVEKAPVEDRGMQTESCTKSATFCVGPSVSCEEAALEDCQSTMTPPPTPAAKRNLEECLSIFRSVVSLFYSRRKILIFFAQEGAAALSDEEVIHLVNHGHIATYQIEKAISDYERGVGIRRKIVGKAGSFIEALENLPYRNYDYSKV